MKGIAWAAGALIALVLGGCANHVRYVDVLEEETRTDLRSQEHAIEGGGDTLRTSRITLKLVRIETYEDRIERRTVRQQEYTPYAGWRELYEVPGGLVSVPLSLGFNVLGAVLLGFIPDEAVRGYTSWTYAALNPALNVESAERMQRRPVEVLSGDTETSERS